MIMHLPRLVAAVELEWRGSCDIVPRLGIEKAAVGKPLRASGEQPRPRIGTERRVGEDHVEGPRLASEKTASVGAMELERVAAELGRRLTERIDKHAQRIDRDG